MGNIVVGICYQLTEQDKDDKDTLDNWNKPNVHRLMGDISMSSWETLTTTVCWRDITAGIGKGTGFWSALMTAS